MILQVTDQFIWNGADTIMLQLIRWKLLQGLATSGTLGIPSTEWIAEPMMLGSNYGSKIH
jgi:hypothetical protein